MSGLPTSSPEALSGEADVEAESGGGEGKRALVGGAAYALVTVAQRALAFLLLPLYAAALTPAEFGDLGILLAATQVFAVVMGLGQNVAVFREWFQLESEPEDRDRYLTTVGALLVAAPAAIAALVVPLALLGARPGLDIDPWLLSASAAGAALFVAATVLPFTILRVQERFGAFVALNLINALVSTGGAVIGLLVFDLGVVAWVFGYVFAGIVTLVVAFFLVPWPAKGRPEERHARSTLSLGLPLLPHQLSLWALQLADRAILVGLVSKTAVGLYTVAYMLAQPIMLISSSVNQAVMPSYGRASVDPEQLPWLSRLTTYQVALIVVLTTGFALVAPPILHLLLPASYEPAAELLPVLCLASGIFSLYAIPMNEVTIFAGRAQKAWIATLLSAALSLALLFVVVPEYGIKGAAWASVAGSSALAISLSIYARRVVDGPRVTYEWGRMGAWVLLACVVYAAAELTTGADDVAALIERLAWSLLLLVGFIPEVRARLQSRG